MKNFDETIKKRMKTGSSMVLKAMDDGAQGMYVVVDSVVGEKPHAALIAVTHENPVLLRKVLKVVKSIRTSKKARSS